MEDIKLYNGDCLEVMDKLIKQGVKVDAIICDPPYGIDFQSMWRKKDERMNKILNDKKPFIEFIPKIQKLLKSTGCSVIFTRWDVQQKFIDVLKNHNNNVKNVIIWDKKVHGMGDLKRAYGSRYESAIFCSNKDFKFQNKRPTDIIACTRVSPNKLLHPNEKPVGLNVELIKDLVPEGGVVLDPFMGSGPTGVACKRLNRKFIGIELDEKYFEIAKERIKGETA